MADYNNRGADREQTPEELVALAKREVEARRDATIDSAREEAKTALLRAGEITEAGRWVPSSYGYVASDREEKALEEIEALNKRKGPLEEGIAKLKAAVTATPELEASLAPQIASREEQLTQLNEQMKRAEGSGRAAEYDPNLSEQARGEMFFVYWKARGGNNDLMSKLSVVNRGVSENVTELLQELDASLQIQGLKPAEIKPLRDQILREALRKLKKVAGGEEFQQGKKEMLEIRRGFAEIAGVGNEWDKKLLSQGRYYVHDANGYAGCPFDRRLAEGELKAYITQVNKIIEDLTRIRNSLQAAGSAKKPLLKTKAGFLEELKRMVGTIDKDYSRFVQIEATNNLMDYQVSAPTSADKMEPIIENFKKWKAAIEWLVKPESQQAYDEALKKMPSGRGLFSMDQQEEAVKADEMITVIEKELE